MADDNITIDIDLNDNFTPRARVVINALEDLGDSATDAMWQFDPFEAALNDTSGELRQADRRAGQAERAIRRLGREALKSAAKIQLLSGSLDRMNGGGPGGGGGGSGGGSGGGGGGPGGKGMKGAVGAMAKFKGLNIVGMFTAIASVIPAAATGIASLGAGAIGLASALAPLGGLIVAYPGYLLALGQGMAVVKLAFNGVSDAVGVLMSPGSSLADINTAMNKLGPSGKEFARTIAGLQGPFTAMRKGVQETLLPSLTEFVKQGRGYLPMVSSALKQTAVSMSGVVRQFTEYTALASTQEKIGQVLANNTQIVGSFGGIAVSAVKMLLTVLNSAGPMLTKMASDAAKFVEKMSMLTEANSGKLGGFFENAYVVLRKVVKLATDLGAGLYQIFKIGTPLGNALIDSFMKLAAVFRGFTDSEAGREKIRQWFIFMTPVLYEIGYLIRDVAKALMGLSMDSQFIDISMALRKDLLPVLVSFIQTASQNLLPSLLKIAVAIIAIIGASAGFGGLATAVKILADFFAVFAAILTTIERALGGLAPVIGMVAGAFVAARVATYLYSTTLSLLGKTFIGARIAATSFGIAMKGAIASTGVGLIVVAIAAIVEIVSVMNSAVDEQTQANKEWAQSLFDVNGALSDNYKATTINKLNTDGTFDAVDKLNAGNAALGITYSEVTEAVTGNKDAFSKLSEKLKIAARETIKTGRFAGQLTPAAKAAQEFLDKLGPMANEFGNASVQAGRAASAIAGFDKGVKETKTTVDLLTDSMRRLDAIFTRRADARTARANVRNLKSTVKDQAKAYLKGSKVAKDAIQASADELMSTAVARADKLKEAGDYAGATKVMQQAQTDATTILTDAFGKKGAESILGPITDEFDIQIIKLRELADLASRYAGYLASTGSVTNTTGPRDVGLDGPVPKGGKGGVAGVRADGGPVAGGLSYLVGERGVEAFISKSGNISMIGKNGPELTRFPSSGYVIPNHALGSGSVDSSSGDLMNAVTGAIASHTIKRQVSGRSEQPSASPVINIGKIEAKSDFDVVRAVKRGIMEAERDSRERR